MKKKQPLIIVNRATFAVLLRFEIQKQTLQPILTPYAWSKPYANGGDNHGIKNVGNSSSSGSNSSSSSINYDCDTDDSIVFNAEDDEEMEQIKIRKLQHKKWKSESPIRSSFISASAIVHPRKAQFTMVSEKGAKYKFSDLPLDLQTQLSRFMHEKEIANASNPLHTEFIFNESIELTEEKFNHYERIFRRNIFILRICHSLPSAYLFTNKHLLNIIHYHRTCEDDGWNDGGSKMNEKHFMNEITACVSSYEKLLHYATFSIDRAMRFADLHSQLRSLRSAFSNYEKYSQNNNQHKYGNNSFKYHAKSADYYKTKPKQEIDTKSLLHEVLLKACADAWGTAISRLAIPLCLAPFGMRMSAVVDWTNTLQPHQVFINRQVKNSGYHCVSDGEEVAIVICDALSPCSFQTFECSVVYQLQELYAKQNILVFSGMGEHSIMSQLSSTSAMVDNVSSSYLTQTGEPKEFFVLFAPKSNKNESFKQAFFPTKKPFNVSSDVIHDEVKYDDEELMNSHEVYKLPSKEMMIHIQEYTHNMNIHSMADREIETNDDYIQYFLNFCENDHRCDLLQLHYCLSQRCENSIASEKCLRIMKYYERNLEMQERNQYFVIDWDAEFKVKIQSPFSFMYIHLLTCKPLSIRKHSDFILGKIYDRILSSVPAIHYNETNPVLFMQYGINPSGIQDSGAQYGEVMASHAIVQEKDYKEKLSHSNFCRPCNYQCRSFYEMKDHKRTPMHHKNMNDAAKEMQCRNDAVWDKYIGIEHNAQVSGDESTKVLEGWMVSSMDDIICTLEKFQEWEINIEREDMTLSKTKHVYKKYKKIIIILGGKMEIFGGSTDLIDGGWMENINCWFLYLNNKKNEYKSKYGALKSN